MGETGILGLGSFVLTPLALFRVIVKLCVVDTVEDFWAMYNNVPSADDIPKGCTYHFFKEGIKPMWEHERNKAGGKWLWVVPRNKRSSLGQVWLDTMLLMIGEQFGDESQEINGAVLACRQKADKLALWTSQATEADACKRIG